MPNNQDFKLLKRQILKNIGFDCSQYKDNYIKRRIAVRMRANNVTSYREYGMILKRDPQEYDILLKALTINVSEFFRDSPVFEVFKKTVIPTLIRDKKRKKQKIIRIWSAGCASGEEVYSMTMVMRDFLDTNFGKYLISIHGTDVDDGSLVKAEKGEYTFDQVKNVGKDFLSRYFIFDGDNYRISDKIKNFVKFERHDLVSDKFLTHFDVIFCRNVFIYFSKEIHDKLHMDFYNALNNDGFYIIGKTEMLRGNARKLFIPLNAKEGIYQKKIKKNGILKA